MSKYHEGPLHVLMQKCKDRVMDQTKLGYQLGPGLNLFPIDSDRSGLNLLNHRVAGVPISAFFNKIPEFLNMKFFWENVATKQLVWVL